MRHSRSQWFNLQAKNNLSSLFDVCFPFQIQLSSQRLCWWSLSSYCWLVICCFYWQFVRRSIKYFISSPELDSLFRVSHTLFSMMLGDFLFPRSVGRADSMLWSLEEWGWVYGLIIFIYSSTLEGNFLSDVCCFYRRISSLIIFIVNLLLLVSSMPKLFGLASNESLTLSYSPNEEVKNSVGFN